jgi:hypothetical protein
LQVRELPDIDKVKIVMMDRFYEIRECYRFYCAMGGHAFGLSVSGFIALMRQARLIDGHAGSGAASSSSNAPILQRAVVSKHSQKIVRFQKPEAENLFITMRGYAKRLQNRLKKKKDEDEDDLDGENVLRGVQQQDQQLTLGVFMETILRCALIKFGHGTPSTEHDHDDEAHMKSLDKPHHHHHHHHHHHQHHHQHHHHHHHHHHEEKDAKDGALATPNHVLTPDEVGADAPTKVVHAEEAHFDGVHDETHMTVEHALEHLLDDYIIAHGASSHSTAFRRLFFYFPEVEDVFVDYFDIISESYLHLCYDSESDLKQQNRFDALGASAASFVNMLHNSGVYAKTNSKLRRIYLLISQSKQAWDWNGSSTGAASRSVDEAVVQYERISFAEYVELVGRLALQLAHEKEIVQQHQMKTAHRRLQKTTKQETKETKNIEKIAKTKHSATLHASLDMDRDMFLSELPLLLNKLHAYLMDINDKGMVLGFINVCTCTMR